MVASESNLPRLEAVSRVAAIPIVESGIEVTEKLYHKIKESNTLVRWYMTLGEKSFSTGVQLALPAVQLLETPITQFDRFLCKSLDLVEKRVPSIYLPPEKMYNETRRYVMRRADSVKQMGTAVLDSRVTAVTADALDRALTTADKYVDKYLPPDQQDAADVTSAEESEAGAEAGGSGRSRAVHAVQHGARLRRKLQRRLTRQALAEAKAIKEQIHVLVYVAELVATDPVLAWQKAKELYASLSKPEPENQARPATLEELMVLLARETARKAVHLFNYTQNDLPNNVRQGLTIVSKHLSTAAEALYKTLPLENALSEVRGWRGKLEVLLQQLQTTWRTYLNDSKLKVNYRTIKKYKLRTKMQGVYGNHSDVSHPFYSGMNSALKLWSEKESVIAKEVPKLKQKQYNLEATLWLTFIAIFMWIFTYIVIVSFLTYGYLDAYRRPIFTEE